MKRISKSVYQKLDINHKLLFEILDDKIEIEEFVNVPNSSDSEKDSEKDKKKPKDLNPRFLGFGACAQLLCHGYYQ